MGQNDSSIRRKQMYYSEEKNRKVGDGANIIDLFLMILWNHKGVFKMDKLVRFYSYLKAQWHPFPETIIFASTTANSASTPLHIRSILS